MRASTLFTWAGIAVVSFGGVLFVLLAEFVEPDGLPLGTPGTVAVLVAAGIATLVGAAVAASSRTPTALRRIAALVLACIAGVAVAMTAVTFASSDSDVAGLGFPLSLGTIGTVVVTIAATAATRHNTRRRPGPA